MAVAERARALIVPPTCKAMTSHTGFPQDAGSSPIKGEDSLWQAWF